jgi:hypothetical protein
MAELKEKTVEELRKMASRKKIEGRSKMNKAELVRALKKKSSTKKTMKRKKMRGGDLTEENMESLLTRNYNTNPLYLTNSENGERKKVELIELLGNGANRKIVFYGIGNSIIFDKEFKLNKLSKSTTDDNLIIVNINNSSRPSGASQSSQSGQSRQSGPKINIRKMFGFEQNTQPEYNNYNIPLENDFWEKYYNPNPTPYGNLIIDRELKDLERYIKNLDEKAKKIYESKELTPKKKKITFALSFHSNQGISRHPEVFTGQINIENKKKALDFIFKKRGHLFGIGTEN